MISAAQASGPKTRKAGTATVPTSTNYISSNAKEHTIIEHRTQRLTAIFGLPVLRARLIADLAWGGASGCA